MGIRETITSYFSKKTITESGIALVQTPKSAVSNDSETPQSRAVKFQGFENAYKNIPLVTAMVDTQADQTVQKFFFEGPNKEKLTEFADKVNLSDFFHRITKCMFIFGNGYVEIVKEGEEITELKVINPIWIDVYRNPTGDVIGYSQTINDKKIILWGKTGKGIEVDKSFTKWLPGKLDTIAHFKYNTISSEKYGMSIIQPLTSSLKIKLEMEQSLNQVLSKYAAPLIWAKVGNDDFPANQQAISDIASTLRDLSAESELTTSHLVDLNVMDFNSKGMDMKTPVDQVTQNIITGGQVPGVLLGMSSGVDKATAEVQLRNFGRHIKSNQRDLKNEFEDNILIKQNLGTPEDKLVWEELEREKEADIDILRGLVTDGVITPQKANDQLPPELQEELPDPAVVAAEMAAAMGTNQGEPGEDGPRPTQNKKTPKVKDGPNDPTKTTKDKKTLGKRTNKTDRKVPIK